MRLHDNSSFGGQEALSLFEWKTHPSKSAAGPCPVCKLLNGLEITENERALLPKPGEVHKNCACSLDPLPSRDLVKDQLERMR